MYFPQLIAFLVFRTFKEYIISDLNYNPNEIKYIKFVYTGIKQNV